MRRSRLRPRPSRSSRLRAMSVQSRSWSLPARPRGVAYPAAFAILLFIAAWFVLHHGWFARGQIIDTPVYEHYGDAMAQGRVPYRDFSVEYPPGALPTFVLPALGHVGDEAGFRRSFETLMWGGGARRSSASG